MFINPGKYLCLVDFKKSEHGCGRIAGTGCQFNLMSIYYYMTDLRTEYNMAYFKFYDYSDEN